MWCLTEEPTQQVADALVEVERMAGNPEPEQARWLVAMDGPMWLEVRDAEGRNPAEWN